MFRPSSPASSMGSYPAEFTYDIGLQNKYSASSLSSELTGRHSPPFPVINQSITRSSTFTKQYVGTPPHSQPKPLLTHSDSFDSWEINSDGPLPEMVKVYSVANSQTSQASTSKGSVIRNKQSWTNGDSTSISTAQHEKENREREKRVGMYRKLYSPPSTPPLFNQSGSFSSSSQNSNLSIVLRSIVKQLKILIQTHTNTKGVFLHPKLFVTPQIYDNDNAVISKDGIVQGGVMIYDGSVKVNVINEVESLLRAVLDYKTEGDKVIKKDTAKSLAYFEKLVLAFGLLGVDNNVNSSTSLNHGNLNKKIAELRLSSSFDHVSVDKSKSEKRLSTSLTLENKQLHNTNSTRTARNSLALTIDTSRSSSTLLTHQGVSSITSTNIAPSHKHTSSISTIKQQVTRIGSTTDTSSSSSANARSLKDQITPMTYFSVLESLLSTIDELQKHLSSEAQTENSVPLLLQSEEEEIMEISNFINEILLKFVWKDVLRCFKVWCHRCVNDYLV